MISTHVTGSSFGSAADIDRAAAAFRQGIYSRLARLLPVLFVALISLSLLCGSPRFTFSMLAQTIACAAMVLAYFFRKRLSISKSAVIVVACLYVCGISTASVAGWMPSSALGTALALVVLQIVLGCQHRFWSLVASIASYLGVGGLAYVYFRETSGTWNLTSADSTPPILPWILMSVSFACFAFIVLVEVEKMLQKIVAAQKSDSAASHAELNGNIQIATGIDSELHRLRASNRNLEMIAYALSHDLRAPLRAIEGFSRSLVEDTGDKASEPVQRDVKEIRAGVDRMQRMVTQWLSFLRGDQSAMHCETIDLSRLAQEVAAELRSCDPERKAVINVQAGLTIHGDAQLLRELLQNLMGNAWKFTQQNDATAKIEVGAYGNSLQTNYFVRDNGAGFSDSDTAKLFTPFVRLHSGQQYEGTGIGLAIARRIVDNHGGRIWAQGQPGFGATFSFALPKPPLASGASTPSMPTDSGRSIFDQRRITQRQ